MGVQSAARAGRRSGTPDPLGQYFDRDGPTGVHRERGHHGTALRGPELLDVPPELQLDRSQQP